MKNTLVIIGSALGLFLVGSAAVAMYNTPATATGSTASTQTVAPSTETLALADAQADEADLYAKADIGAAVSAARNAQPDTQFVRVLPAEPIKPSQKAAVAAAQQAQPAAKVVAAPKAAMPTKARQAAAVAAAKLAQPAAKVVTAPNTAMPATTPADPTQKVIEQKIIETPKAVAAETQPVADSFTTAADTMRDLYEATFVAAGLEDLSAATEQAVQNVEEEVLSPSAPRY